jgi:hypothetical protein
LPSEGTSQKVSVFLERVLDVELAKLNWTSLGTLKVVVVFSTRVGPYSIGKGGIVLSGNFTSRVCVLKKNSLLPFSILF